MRQSPALVAEDLQGEAGVELRIVDAPALELAVLVVVDKMVVGVARKGKGLRCSVDRRQLQQAQVEFEVGQIEGNEVVAEQESVLSASLSILISTASRLEAATGEHQSLIVIGANPRKGVDASVPFANFEVEGRAGAQRMVVHGCLPSLEDGMTPACWFPGGPGAAACGQLQHRCSKAFTCILHAARSMSGSVTGRATVWREGKSTRGRSNVAPCKFGSTRQCASLSRRPKPCAQMIECGLGSMENYFLAADVFWRVYEGQEKCIPPRK